VAFSVPDLQGFRSYLDGECVAVTASSSNLPQFFVADPSGNVIEFTALARQVVGVDAFAQSELTAEYSLRPLGGDEVVGVAVVGRALGAQPHGAVLDGDLDGSRVSAGQEVEAASVRVQVFAADGLRLSGSDARTRRPEGP
jgi:hypothetical protein